MKCTITGLLVILFTEMALAQDAPRAPTPTSAPPVVEAAPTRPVDLSPLLRALGLLGPDERVVKVLSMAPTTDNVRDLLRLLADMPEVEIEVAGKDGVAQKRRVVVPGRPPASQAEPTAEDAEFEQVARELSLRPEQREAVRAAIKKGQAEFERRLREASANGADDLSVIEKVGREVSKATGEQIRKVLDAGQAKKFDEYMRENEAPPAPDEGGRKAPREPEPPTPTARPA